MKRVLESDKLLVLSQLNKNILDLSVLLNNHRGLVDRGITECEIDLLSVKLLIAYESYCELEDYLKLVMSNVLKYKYLFELRKLVSILDLLKYSIHLVKTL